MSKAEERRRELTLSEDDVRDEHMSSVRPGVHWAYLWGVLVGSFLLMVALIALLGSAGG